MNARTVDCPYQKLDRPREERPKACIKVINTRLQSSRTLRCAISVDDRRPVLMPNGRTPASAAVGVPRAMVRRRDVRGGDANRRHVGLERSSRRLAVGQPAGREHRCPARGECATRDSR